MSQNRSIRLDGIYRIEEIDKNIMQTQKQSDLLVYYIDHIRNYKELTKEMMENIKKFDDNSKMLLINEYNIVIKSLICLLE